MAGNITEPEFRKFYKAEEDRWGPQQGIAADTVQTVAGVVSDPAVLGTAASADTAADGQPQATTLHGINKKLSFKKGL